MGFKVTYTNSPATQHGDQDAYEFLDRGILKITESTGKTSYLVMDFWNSLIADPGHEPGGTGGPAPDVLDTVPE
jgi:hypothetical protein